MYLLVFEFQFKNVYFKKRVYFFDKKNIFLKKVILKRIFLLLKKKLNEFVK